MILILSRDSDIHAQHVISLLEKRGKESQLFNPALYPLNATVSVGSTPVGQAAHLGWDDHCLNLNDVRAVWTRRPQSAALPYAYPEAEGGWLKEECRMLFRSLWSNITDAVWVSPPHHIRHADLKLRQLRIAHELGFTIPPYLVTNQPEEARSFLRANPQGVIVKALHRPAIMGERKAATIYTHLINAEDMVHLDSVRYGPTYFQAFVEKKRDLRITVVGDKIFPVAIESRVAEEAYTDFRRAEVFDMPHEPVTLPPKLEKACFDLVKRLGLNFGAIDILETAKGEFYFLEINPNGQWMWIEWVTELPIGEAMCDLLLGESYVE
ncbi:MAG: MvdC/MvdD family ATP grasp protein [Chloroflexota bacterium]